jgi:hypothetical protein
MKRQPDGTWRSTRQPIVVSEGTFRARWQEAEISRLKTMGLSFEEIAEAITRVGRGEAQPMIPVPPGVSFPPGYTLSKQACHKAFTRALAKQPTIAIQELRKVDYARSEEMFLNLQPGIRKGNTRSIDVGLKVLDHTARIQGYTAPQKHELTGKDGRPLTLLQLLEEVGDLDEED